MERSEILTAMAELKLYGMKAAFDEIIGTAVKRQHEPVRIVGVRIPTMSAVDSDRNRPPIPIEASRGFR